MTIHYQRSSEALHARVGDDVVALHVRNGRCFGMEQVTADIWRHLETAITFDQICERLMVEYDVDPETCHADVEAILDTMRQEGLVDELATQENEH